jgi:serine protein kinase
MTTTDKASNSGQQQQALMDRLVAFTRDHRAASWSGSLSQFLETILPADPKAAARTSHQYMWDMIRWTRGEDGSGNIAKPLFSEELFGVDESIERVVDYFKAAAAGSEVGRRLLLLLGPPSGGKSSLVILLKRRPGRVQHHRCRRTLWHTGLPGARIAAAPSAAQPPGAFP